MIVVDTSALIRSLTGRKPSAPQLRAYIEAGERLVLPALVLYEWFRGPRSTADLAAQDAIFPTNHALGFGAAEADSASRLYKEMPNPRGREIDIAIAAHAIVRNAQLWTHSIEDFEDVPGLVLAEPTV